MSGKTYEAAKTVIAAAESGEAISSPDLAMGPGSRSRIVTADGERSRADPESSALAMLEPR
jgi:hypothetical protein